MTPDEANRASLTLEDVFTPEGDAAVIERLFTPASTTHPYAGQQCAYVVGRHGHKWYPISKLSTAEALRADSRLPLDEAWTAARSEYVERGGSIVGCVMTEAPCPKCGKATKPAGRYFDTDMWAHVNTDLMLCEPRDERTEDERLSDLYEEYAEYCVYAEKYPTQEGLVMWLLDLRDEACRTGATGDAEDATEAIRRTVRDLERLANRKS